MSVIQDYIIPIITVALALSMVLFVLLLIYKVIRYIFRGFGLWWKYSFLGKYKEQDVEKAFEAYEKGYSSNELEKFLLMKNVDEKKVKELVYIFKKIEAKRGKTREVKDNGKFGQTYEEIRF